MDDIPTPSGLFGALLNKISWRKLANRAKFRDMPPYDDDYFVIAVAELEDDDKAGTQRKHVLRGLQSFFKALNTDSSIEVVDWGRQLKIPEVGASRARFEQAVKQGQNWLEEKNADVLIYGAVSGHNKVLALRFLVRGTESDQAHQSFQLDEKLELQSDFDEQALAALAAKIVTNMDPMYQGGKYIVPIARPLADKIGALLPIIQTGTQQATDLLVKWADLNLLIGRQTGKTARFQNAITAYQQALKERTRDKGPLDWAGAQNNLGTALLTLGERGDDEALAQAITAYGEALKERTRDKVSLQWAITQNNLGTALSTLGERGDGEALVQAITAYEGSVEVFEKHGHGPRLKVARAGLKAAQALREKRRS